MARVTMVEITFDFVQVAEGNVWDLPAVAD